MGKAIYKYTLEPTSEAFVYKTNAPFDVDFISGLDFTGDGFGFLYGKVDPRDGNLAEYKVYILPTGIEFDDDFWTHLELYCYYLGTFKDGNFRWHVWVEEPILDYSPFDED